MVIFFSKEPDSKYFRMWGGGGGGGGGHIVAIATIKKIFLAQKLPLMVQEQNEGDCTIIKHFQKQAAGHSLLTSTHFFQSF